MASSGKERSAAGTAAHLRGRSLPVPHRASRLVRDRGARRKIEGEQAAQGIAIAFEDLVIGATALHFGFDVATLNVKHFKLIPGLKIVTP
jgi:predicted nucleic acid-binding protein